MAMESGELNRRSSDCETCVAWSPVAVSSSLANLSLSESGGAAAARAAATGAAATPAANLNAHRPPRRFECRLPVEAEHAKKRRSTSPGIPPVAAAASVVGFVRCLPPPLVGGIQDEVNIFA